MHGMTRTRLSEDKQALGLVRDQLRLVGCLTNKNKYYVQFYRTR